jgi:hypothetical protein
MFAAEVSNKLINSRILGDLEMEAAEARGTLGSGEWTTPYFLMDAFLTVAQVCLVPLMMTWRAPDVPPTRSEVVRLFLRALSGARDMYAGHFGMGDE